MTSILHVANFGSRAKGAFLHKVEHKITNGLIRNGHQVACLSDREIARPNSALRLGAIGGRGRVNRVIGEFCRAMRPEVLFLGHADLIEPATISALRADLPQLRVLQWNVDPMFMPENVARLVSKLEVVDATLVSTAGEALAPLRRTGKLLGFLPNPVDFSIERGRNHETAELSYDLFLAAGRPDRPLRVIGGKAWNLDDLIAELRRRLPGLRTLTPGLQGAPNLGGAAYQQAAESAALGLNISRRDDYLLYSSDRIAQLCGNGQVVLTPRATGYGQLFSEGEMVFFDGLDDLAEAIAGLIAEPERRMRIAAAGRARYHALFNERVVAAYMLDVALGRADPAAYAWPTLVD
jgi:hypothetical protein